MDDDHQIEAHLQHNFHLLECSPPAETTGPIFTKILHDIVALVMLFNHAYTRRYSIPFLNARAISARGVGNSATKLVAMATSLEESEKLDMIKKIHANTFHLVKRS